MRTLFERAEEIVLARAVREARSICCDAKELWEKGFTPSSGKLYNFKAFSIEDYLSDLQREMTAGINGPWAAVLDSKIVFAHVFGAVVPTPRIVAHTNLNSLVGELQPGLAFFAKPAAGGGGIGVIQGKVTSSGIQIKESIVTQFDFERMLLEHRAGPRNHYIITESVTPHEVVSRLFPATTNTVRMLMMRDDEGVFIASAVIRIGSKDSGFVDNFSAGGLSCSIDISTGKIGPARRKNGQSLLSHPDTGQPIAGRRLPFWTETKRAAHMAMEHCPALRYVGWDIVISRVGPVFLEGNHYSDVNLLQVHKPLLRDDRVKAFYEANGVLSYWPRKSLPPLDN